MNPAPFPVDPALTAIAIAYRNMGGMLIADQVLPDVPVAAEDFKWTEYPVNDAYRAPDTRVSRKGVVQELEFGGEEKTSSVEDHGLDLKLPNSLIAKYAAARAAGTSSHDPEQHGVQMITDQLMNRREIEVAGLVHNPASYDAALRETLAGGDQFSDYATSNPITVIKDALNSGLMPFNTMVIGHEVAQKLTSHPQLVKAIRSTDSGEGIVTLAQILDLFRGEGLQRILVGQARVVLGNAGANDTTPVRAWGKHMAFLHINRGATTEYGMTFGMTAKLGTRIAGSIDEPKLGLEGGRLVRVGERRKSLIVAKGLGYLVQNAVA